MTIVAAHPARTTGLDLEVERAGIRFHNVSHDRVAIEIEVRNGGASTSPPTRMRVESALFGAFLPWRPLAELEVPPIEAGRVARVRFEVRQERPAPVPGAARAIVPPALPTRVAAGAGDADRRRVRPAIPSREALAARARAVVAQNQRIGALAMLAGGFAPVREASSGRLPPDLLDVVAGRHPSWNGNLNVWVGGRAVERHCGTSRIERGRANIAVFLVGSGADAYAFQLDDGGSSWTAVLVDGSANSIPWSGKGWRDLRWLPIEHTSAILLALRPPDDAAAADIAVNVLQRSTGKTASVEFHLDPDAPGPGCIAE